MILIIVYVFLGIFFYVYGLMRMKKYGQEFQPKKTIVYNFILIALIWPAYVMKAIDTLAKTGVYKND